MTDARKVDINRVGFDVLRHEGCIKAKCVGSGVSVEVIEVAKFEVGISGGTVGVPSATCNGLTQCHGALVNETLSAPSCPFRLLEGSELHGLYRVGPSRKGGGSNGRISSPGEA